MKARLRTAGKCAGLCIVIVTAVAGIFAMTPVTFAAVRSSARVETGTDPEVRRTAPILNWQLQPKTGAQPAMKGAAAPAAAVAAQEPTESFGPNLIQNPSLTQVDVSGMPVGWYKGGYGTNTRSYQYPVLGDTAANKGVRVSISAYTSGDAKWYFADVPVTPGKTYQFSDYSKSSTSTIDVRFKMSDGTYIYSDIAAVAAHASYTQSVARFTAPSGAVSATIFHLIDAVGSLDTTDFSLNEVIPAASGNLVRNGNLEAGSPGAPTYWNKGGYGVNTRTFQYPVPGVSGNGVRASITSYTSGDAKWYFDPVVVQPGVYTYADQYQSNVPSSLNIRLHNPDGSYTYKDIATLPATGASVFKPVSVDFVVPSGTQDVTVFHLIQSVGSITIDNVSLTRNTGGQGIFSTGAVTFTFDDGYLSQYQNAVPMLDAAGFKGTFYIVTQQMADQGYTDFMSVAQVKQLASAGHEIGAHTRTHPHLPMLSASQQQDEILGSRQDLLAMNVGPIASFAYPFGEYDTTTLQIVQQAGFASARSTISGPTFSTSDHYQLPRQRMINTTTVAQVQQWVDEAIANKTWAILAFHRIDTSGETYSTTPSDFNQIVAYVKSKGVPVVTVSQGVGDMTP